VALQDVLDDAVGLAEQIGGSGPLVVATSGHRSNVLFA
jgi:hypothetical protein